MESPPAPRWIIIVILDEFLRIFSIRNQGPLPEHPAPPTPTYCHLPPPTPTVPGRNGTLRMARAAHRPAFFPSS